MKWVNRIYFNHNSDLITYLRWQYLYYACYQVPKSIHTCTHTDTKIYKCVKVYLLKIPLEFSEILTSNVSAFLGGRGLSLKEWRVSAQVPSSVFGDAPLNFAILRVRELSEASHAEGDAECGPLRSGRAQRASVRTTVCKVVRWLTLGISKFPSWPQSGSAVTGILKITDPVARMEIYWCLKSIILWPYKQNAQVRHLTSPGPQRSASSISLWMGCLSEPSDSKFKVTMADWTWAEL